MPTLIPNRFRVFIFAITLRMYLLKPGGSPHTMDQVETALSFVLGTVM
jgi:hypothetical protein